MLKRLIIFILIIGGVLYFALKDDAKDTETPTLSDQLEERADNLNFKEEAKKEETKKSEKDKEVKEEADKKSDFAETTPDKEEVKTEVSKTETPKEEKAAVVVKTDSSVVIGPQPAPTPVYVKPVVKQLRASDVQQYMKVFLYDWEIDVSDLNVQAEVTQFEVQNNGKFSHDFAIKGGADFGNVRPGETKVFITRLKRGNVTLYSPKNADVERGMQEVISAR